MRTPVQLKRLAHQAPLFGAPPSWAPCPMPHAPPSSAPCPMHTVVKCPARQPVIHTGSRYPSSPPTRHTCRVMSPVQPANPSGVHCDNVHHAEIKLAAGPPQSLTRACRAAGMTYPPIPDSCLLRRRVPGGALRILAVTWPCGMALWHGPVPPGPGPAQASTGDS